MKQFYIIIRNRKKIREVLGLENEWEERRAIYRKESGKSSLRTRYLTIVVNAETESRIERRLRQRDQKMQKPNRINVFLCI